MRYFDFDTTHRGYDEFRARPNLPCRIGDWFEDRWLEREHFDGSRRWRWLFWIARRFWTVDEWLRRG